MVLLNINIILIFFYSLFLQYPQVLGYHAIKCPEKSNATAVRRLRSTLFCDYDSAERPVKNLTQPAIVNIAIDLIYMNIVDAPEFALRTTLNSRIIINWKDERLSWDPSLFENITQLTVNSHNVWYPDIQVIDSGSGDSSLSQIQSCILDRWGDITCTPSVLLPLFCHRYSSQWPNDARECVVKLGSWSHVSNEVQLRLFLEGFRKNNYIKNPVWDFGDLIIRHKSVEYPCCPGEEYYTFSYYLIFYRKQLLIWATVLFPAIAIFIITLLSFGIYKFSTRLMLCLTSFLANLLMLIFLGFKVPDDGFQVAKIVIVYITSFIMSGVAIVISYIKHIMENKIDTPQWVYLFRKIILRQNINETPATLLVNDEEGSELNNMEMGRVLNNRSQDQSMQMGLNYSKKAVIFNRIAFCCFLIVYISVILNIYISRGQLEFDEDY